MLRGSHKAGRIDHIRVGDQIGADVERVQQLMKVGGPVAGEAIGSCHVFYYTDYKIRTRKCGQ